MRNFVSITAVLSIVLLATQVVAQAPTFEDSVAEDLREIDEPQLFFGGRRQGGPSRIQQYDEPFGIKKVSYPRELRNHALVRFNARKHQDIQLPVPAGFSTSSSSLVEDPIQNMLDNLDVWSRSSNDMVLAHFTDKQFELFEKAMLRKGVPESENEWQVVERDLQQVADEDAEMIYMTNVNQQLLSASGSPESELLVADKKKRVDLNTWFKNYHPHNEIKDFYLQLADDYPNLITYIPSIGKTVEGRDIFAIKLTAKEEDGSIKEKPQIWWQGLQHAREWAGGSTVQYLTHHLTSNYGKNDVVTAILRDTEFVIVPVMNLDGYDYTWTNNRLWRKNRSKVGMGMYGVDLNRNWDDHFGEGGSSNLPWSETYRGPHAASEPEVKAMQDFFSAQKRIVGAIDFHCYSQLVLRPEGWTTAPAPHEKEHKFVGDKIVSLIQSVHGKKYISEPSVALYKTTGAGSDWFYGEKATKANNGQRVYSYTIELRPSENGGRNGFVLPPEEILPLGEEIAKAMEFFVDYVVKNPLNASHSGAKTAGPGTGPGTGTGYPFQERSTQRLHPAQQDSQRPLPPTPPAPPPHDEPLSLTRLSPGTNVLAEKTLHENKHPLPPVPPPLPSKSFYNDSKLTTPAFIEAFLARHPRVARHRRRFAALLFTLTTLLILLIVLLAVLLSRKSGSGGYEEGIGGGGHTGSDGGSAATDEALKKHNQGIPRPPINRSNAGGWTKQGKGEGTYYDPSIRVGTDKFTMGACEFEYINSMQDMIAALNRPDFGNFPRSSNSPACGQCIRVTGPNGTVDVQIVDMCPGCKSGDIDLTPGAFSKIADIDAGRVRITWERCP